MLSFGCNVVYLKYYFLNLMSPMVYPKVLFGVDIHRYIQCLGSGHQISANVLLKKGMCNFGE